MGLNQGNVRATYLKVKEGKLYLSNDAECANPFESVVGSVSGFYFRNEEFNGTPVEKMYLTITDDENYRIGFQVGGTMWGKLISYLKNADLTKPIELSFGTEQDDKNPERKYNTVFVKQNGKNLKGFYSRDTGNTLPDWKPVKVGNKTLWDKSDWEGALREVVEKEFIPTINTPTSNFESEPTPSQQDVTDTDDLPF